MFLTSSLAVSLSTSLPVGPLPQSNPSTTSDADTDYDIPDHSLDNTPAVAHVRSLTAADNLVQAPDNDTHYF